MELAGILGLGSDQLIANRRSERDLILKKEMSLENNQKMLAPLDTDMVLIESLYGDCMSGKYERHQRIKKKIKICLQIEVSTNKANYNSNLR